MNAETMTDEEFESDIRAKYPEMFVSRDGDGALDLATVLMGTRRVVCFADMDEFRVLEESK